MIRIGKPYIKETKDNAVRLCCVVNYAGKDEEIWYEVEKKFAQYLCFERADAFLLAFLPYAMAFKHDIKVDGAISEMLYYQLSRYYIPSMAKFSNYYKQIEIEYGNLDDRDLSGQAVGTGFSAGVDSFYSVLNHINNPEKSFTVTHLTFFKVGATGSFGGVEAENTFRKRTNDFKQFAIDNNLEFVIVDSNISEHAKMSFNYIHTFRSMSAVLALQKLFSKYYYASTATVGDFEFNIVDIANIDFFNLNNFSVEGMRFYSTGRDCERLEKQKFIQDYKVTYEFLNVCNSATYNCSRCEKCLRTMAGFQCLGTLEKYKNVFDVDYYKNNFSKCMGFLIGKSFDGTAEGAIDANLIKNMKHCGIKIPISSHFFAIPTAIKSFAYKIARKSKFLKNWYHKKYCSQSGCNFADE